MVLPGRASCVVLGLGPFWGVIMDMLSLFEAVSEGIVLPVLLVFLVWNNSKLIDKIIDKLITSNNNKKK